MTRLGCQFLPVTSGSNLLFPLDILAHRYPHLVRRKWCPRVQHSRLTVRTHLHVADFNLSFPLVLKGHTTLQRRTTLLVALGVRLDDLSSGHLAVESQQPIITKLPVMEHKAL